MTKEITKAYILQELGEKLGLREFEAEAFRFSEEVVPVYNIEPHLGRWEVGIAQKSITAGPQGYLFFTVPQNEKWYVRGYNIIFMAAGAYKVTGVYIDRRIPTVSYIYLDMVEGQTVSYAKNLPVPAELNPGMRLYVYVDDYTSTADLQLSIDVLKETIR